MSDPYDLPIFGLPVIDSPKVFRQWSRIYNEPVSQARFAAAIGLFDQSVSQAKPAAAVPADAPGLNVIQ
jgi:hypothetical protein